MQPLSEASLITNVDQLDQLLGPIGEASLKKELPYVHPHYRTFIEASPFAVLASIGPGGLDVSPRGDPAGFVVVENETTLLLPERRGNNRADSLRNLISNPQMALLFLIPGIGETLRVNGRARITTDPDLLQRFMVGNKPPKCVLVVSVESVFFQCARAIQRSGLWESADANIRQRVPSAGTMLASFTSGGIDGLQYDLDLPARQKATLY